MNWYLVKMIFQIICGNGGHKPQFEEQLRLVLANDEEEAIAKTNCIALQEEETFLNESKQLVQWKFIAATDIYPLQTGMDGAALFSRISEEENATMFIHATKLRSQDLLKNFTTIIHQ